MQSWFCLVRERRSGGFLETDGSPTPRTHPQANLFSPEADTFRISARAGRTRHRTLPSLCIHRKQKRPATRQPPPCPTNCPTSHAPHPPTTHPHPIQARAQHDRRAWLSSAPTPAYCFLPPRRPRHHTQHRHEFLLLLLFFLHACLPSHLHRSVRLLPLPTLHSIQAHPPTPTDPLHYRPHLLSGKAAETDWVKDLDLSAATALLPPDQHAPRILVLYGSLRSRSYSKLLAFEMARILDLLGAEVGRWVGGWVGGDVCSHTHILH